MYAFRTTIICCLLAVPALAEDAPSVAPGEVVQFHLTAKPGDVNRTRIVTNTFGSMTLFGNMPSQKFSQKFEQELTMKCLKVDADGNMVFEMTMPEIAMQMNIGGIKVTFDSRQPAAASQPVFGFVNRFFEAMTHVKCTITLSPQGEPLKVEGLKEAVDIVLKESGDALAVPGIRQMVDQMQEFLGDDVVAESLRSNARLFPDGGKAHVGDKWTREWQTKMSAFNLAMHGSGEYVLAGVETLRGHRCAKIRAKSTLSAVSEDPSQQPTGSKPRGLLARMKFKINASGSDTVAYVDLASGQVVQVRETGRTVIDFNMEPDPNATEQEMKPGLRKITQTMTTSVQIDLLEDEPSGDSVRPAEARDRSAAATAPAN